MTRRLALLTLLLSAGCHQPSTQPTASLRYLGAWQEEDDGPRVVVRGYCDDPLGREVYVSVALTEGPPTQEDLDAAERATAADPDNPVLVSFPSAWTDPVEGTDDVDLVVKPYGARGRYEVTGNCSATAGDSVTDADVLVFWW